MSNNIEIYTYDPKTKVKGELLFIEEVEGNLNDGSFNGAFLIESVLQPKPELKEADIVSFPEEDGDRIDINPNMQSFEYEFTLSFILGTAQSETAVNEKIISMQDAIRGKCVAVVNNYRKQVMVGYIIKSFEIQEAQKRSYGYNYRDMVDFKVTVNVNDPSLCNYKNTTI